MSSEGHIEEANPAFCRIIDYTPAEIRGRHFREITHPDDVTADIESVQAVLDGKIRSYLMAKRYLTKLGQVVWIRLRVYAVFDDAGRPHLLMAQVAPISSVEMPPTLEHEIGRKRAAQARFASVQWVLVLGAGVGLAVTGALLENQQLSLAGLGLITASGGATAWAITKNKDQK